MKALWVEPIEPIGPPKKSQPIPIPGAKIEEVEEGCVIETDKSDWKEDDKVKGMYTYGEKEKPITIEQID